MSKDIRRALMVAKNVGASADDSHPATQIPGVHISERTHGKPIFTGERIGKEGGGSLTSQDQDGEDGITAYQGGPHSVGPEGYSNDKIGTGEGAQVYGYGHYFAEHEPVAKQYRDQLSSDMYRTSEGELFDPTSLKHLNVRVATRKGGIEGGIDRARGILFRPDESADNILEMAKSDLETLMRMKEKSVVPHVGHMHQVRIQGRPEHFLDWDKPLSEQSEYVRNALQKRDPTEILDTDQRYGSGRDYYHALVGQHSQDAPLHLSADQGERWAAPRASDDLLKAGIKGIRYLDQGSRNNYLVKDAPDGTANMTDRHGNVISNHPTRQEAHAAGKEMGSRNYVVFDPKHIDIQRRYARGGMAYADGGSLPDAGVQKALDLTRDLNPQGLYSHAAEAALASPQAKGPLPQMLASLKGVKPDELKYSGVEQAFAGQPRVTREELAQHFQKGLPDIQETTMRQGVNKNIAKYKDYTLPGGENYREILMHLPDGPSNYASTHWRQQPNVLAHLRLKDRIGPNGEKILHAEEVQSDWGQQARRDGTYNAARPYQVFEPNTGKVLSEHASFEEARDEAKKHEDAGNYGIDYGHAVDSQTNKEPVPDAPYIGNTQNWTDLALKRLLHEAAAGGYDKVVYTPGVEQAKRYGKGDSSGMEGYYDKVLPKSLLALARQHDPEITLGSHDLAAGKFNHASYGQLNVLGEVLGEQPDSLIGSLALNDMRREGHDVSVQGLNEVGHDNIKNAINDAERRVMDYYGEVVPDQNMTRDISEATGGDLNSLEASWILSEIKDSGYHDLSEVPEGEFLEIVDRGISKAGQAEKKLRDLYSSKPLPGLTITPRMRESILKRGFKAYARGGDVEGTMRIAKAGGGPLGDDETVKKALALTAPQKVTDHPAWIPTRLVTSKKAGPQGKNVVDLASLKATPDLYEKNVGLLKDYPNIRSQFSGSSSDDVAKEFVRHATENLLALHDAVPDHIRNRSKLWYDGARAITDRWSQEYGLPDHSIAGVLAALSPQKDWYQNVSLAKRVLNTMRGNGENFYHGFTFSPEMEATFRGRDSLNKPKYEGLLNMVRGKSLGDIDKGEGSPEEKSILKALWVRMHDETHGSPEHPIITPEGNEGELVKTAKGANAKVGWGSMTEIAKAIRAIEAQNDPDVISALMGEKHKVRNFYNNILVPNSRHGDITADTHAVAAALYRPLSGQSTEVAHNFANSTGPGIPAAGGSALTGIQGTYPLYAEAYRKAAKARGILPREMQSITWEAVRGLFPDTFKTAKNSKAVDAIWNQYKAGKIPQSEARRQVDEIAGGIRNPTWHVEGNAGPNEAGGYSDNPRELSGTGAYGEPTQAPDTGAGVGSPLAVPQKRLTEADGGAVSRALQIALQHGKPLPDAVNLARQHTRGRP